MKETRLKVSKKKNKEAGECAVPMVRVKDDEIWMGSIQKGIFICFFGQENLKSTELQYIV